jgi:hypothetical protein
MAVHIAPIVQEVTTHEALQSGGNAKRELTPLEQKKINAFIQAHAQTQQTQPTAPTQIDKNVNAALNGKPQVSAEEQAAAVALKGATRDAQKRPSDKYRKIYQVLFTADTNFLAKDIDSLRHAVNTKGKCLVDLATNLNPQEKALRKYVLVQIALAQDDLSTTETKVLTDYKKLILSIPEHNHFISNSLHTFSIAKQTNLGKATLKEFIRGYQTQEIQPQETSPEILALLRAIKKNTTQEDLSKSMQKMRESFIALLSREKSQNPTKVTSPRHHLILSRINQITILIKAEKIHARFLECCEKAKLQKLPSLNSLLEVGLQAVASNEPISAVNAITRAAAAVTAENKPAKNIFITLYNRFVLKSDLMKDVFKTNKYRRQFIDGLDQNIKAGGILAIGADNATVN